MTDTHNTPDNKIDALIESWIIINVKDPQYVKEAKIEARRDFKAALTRWKDRAVLGARVDTLERIYGVENGELILRPSRVARALYERYSTDLIQLQKETI